MAEILANGHASVLANACTIEIDVSESQIWVMANDYLKSTK